MTSDPLVEDATWRGRLELAQVEADVLERWRRRELGAESSAPRQPPLPFGERSARFRKDALSEPRSVMGDPAQSDPRVSKGRCPARYRFVRTYVSPPSKSEMLVAFAVNVTGPYLLCGRR